MFFRGDNLTCLRVLYSPPVPSYFRHKVTLYVREGTWGKKSVADVRRLILTCMCAVRCHSAKLRD